MVRRCRYETRSHGSLISPTSAGSLCRYNELSIFISGQVTYCTHPHGHFLSMNSFARYEAIALGYLLYGSAMWQSSEI